MTDTMLISENETSYLVDRSWRDINGFCKGCPLRRHRFEEKTNEGSLRCRHDWVEYIGPIERWGSCNPWDGHFGAVVLPFCRPEKLAILCYIFEYKHPDTPTTLGPCPQDTDEMRLTCIDAFLYDNVVESAAKCTACVSIVNKRAQGQESDMVL